MSKVFNKILHNESLDRVKSTNLVTHSIIRNIQYILNTRSSFGVKKFLDNRTILDNLSFGIPDLSFISMRSAGDKEKLSKIIEKAIVAFEPRLKGVSIDLGHYDLLNREINVKVSAHFDRNNIAVNFLLNLSTLEFLIDERER